MVRITGWVALVFVLNSSVCKSEPPKRKETPEEKVVAEYLHARGRADWLSVTRKLHSESLDILKRMFQELFKTANDDIDLQQKLVHLFGVGKSFRELERQPVEFLVSSLLKNVLEEGADIKEALR